MTTTSTPAGTARSARARVLTSAPEPSGLDTVADVRAMRAEDGAVADAAALRRSRAHGSEEDSEAAGAVLLARLSVR